MDIAILMAVLIVAGLGVYVVAKSGSPFPKPKPRPRTPRDDLIEARDRLQRQIEVAECPSRVRWDTRNTWSQNDLETLRAELRAVEEQLGSST